MRAGNESRKELFEDLKERGLRGAKFDTSDAPEGLEEAL